MPRPRRLAGLPVTTNDRRAVPAVSRLMAGVVMPGPPSHMRCSQAAAGMHAQPIFERYRHRYGQNAQVEETPKDDQC